MKDLILMILVLISVGFGLRYFIKYKKEIREIENKRKKDSDLLKIFDIDVMIRLGYGFLIEDKFDKIDEKELSILTKQEDLSINGLFEKEINIGYQYFTLKRYTFDSPNARYPVYMFCNEYGNRKLFAWQFNEILKFLENK
mgnify:CR=1